MIVEVDTGIIWGQIANIETCARSLRLAGVVVSGGERMAGANAAKADLLEQLAGDLHSLAFDVREPSRSLQRADRLINEGERIASAVRRAFRG